MSGDRRRSDPEAARRLAHAAAQLWHDPEKRASWAMRARAAVDPGGADRAAATLLAAITRHAHANAAPT